MTNLIKEMFVGKYMLKSDCVVSGSKAQHHRSINKIKWKVQGVRRIIDYIYKIEIFAC